jgi:hypothetical protein
MFRDVSTLLRDNVARRHGGVAVLDVDGDGIDEWFVCNRDGPNAVLKWSGAGYALTTPARLADPSRSAFGVAAADLDADGREEIAVVNPDSSGHVGPFADRLFAWRDGRWLDLFELPVNAQMRQAASGRAVAVLDRFGTGKYAVVIASPSRALRLIEEENRQLFDSAAEAGLARHAGGLGLLPVPLLSEAGDLFVSNPTGPNSFFRHLEDGTFRELAGSLRLDDPGEPAVALAAVDDPRSECFACLVGSWHGCHRLFVERRSSSTVTFKDVATPALAWPSPIRTIVPADFDNDGYEEIVFINSGEPNRLFGWRDERWTPLDIGAAQEPFSDATGAAVADLDGDGCLELLITHGSEQPQPLTLYRGPGQGCHWLRVRPKTRAGAPARGAVVLLQAAGRCQRRYIHGGNGSCQMEPVAHFGLGECRLVDWIQVHWPDGSHLQWRQPSSDQTLVVEYPQ